MSNHLQITLSIMGIVVLVYVRAAIIHADKVLAARRITKAVIAKAQKTSRQAILNKRIRLLK
jgi:hypothetical protein